MAKKSASTELHEVSPNNPCPFLRGLVANGKINDDVATLGDLTTAIQQVAKTGEGQPTLPCAAIRGVALIANGFGPLTAARNALQGVQINELRNGPLDKKGVGSGILDALGKINYKELDRLDDFATDKTANNGTVERGLNAAEIKRMMDANFERAAGHRRVVDRKMMDAEWPILLDVMGKKGKAGRYLSVIDVRELFTNRQFPQRMQKQF